MYIDADLVTQVLLNVTLNAVQAMPSGGALRYEVRRVRRRPAPRGPGRRAERSPRARAAVPPAWIAYQQVRVIDTGVGIPRGVRAPSCSIRSSRPSPRAPGSGSRISQTIMQEHGGSIAVASREGHGTTVLLSLPVEKRHGERREPTSDAGVAHTLLDR